MHVVLLVFMMIRTRRDRSLGGARLLFHLLVTLDQDLSVTRYMCACISHANFKAQQNRKHAESSALSHPANPHPATLSPSREQ